MRVFSRFLVAIMIIPLLGFAQTISIDNLIVYDDALEVLYTADLDLMQQNTGRQLFSMTITNQSGEVYTNCTMEIRITKDGGMISEAFSLPFVIPAGIQSYDIDNVSLINNGFSFNPQDPATKIRFDHARVSDEVEGLQKELLTSGKVPIGSYFLTVEILQNGTLIDPSASVRQILLIQATNPSFVQPLTPGNPASSGEPGSVFTQYPMFQWTGNGAEYSIVVFESRPGMSSMDDIINGVPSWESQRTNGFNLQYPSGEAVPLEYGKNYYWVVKMFVQTSSGEEVVDSDIYQFRMVDPTNLDKGAARLVKSEIIEFLRQFIGDRADEIGQKLEEYDLSKIIFNGEPVSLDDLRQQIGSGKYKKDEVEVVDVDLK